MARKAKLIHLYKQARNDLLLAFICLFAAITLHAQTVCPAGSQCLDNASITKCSQIADEVVALRKVVADFQIERGANAQLAADQKLLIDKLHQIIAIDDLQSAAEEKYRATLDAIVKIQADLIQQLEKKIANGKGFWGKLLVKLQLFYYALSTALLIAK